MMCQAAVLRRWEERALTILDREPTVSVNPVSGEQYAKPGVMLSLPHPVGFGPTARQGGLDDARPETPTTTQAPAGMAPRRPRGSRAASGR
jgi:hypothetical protein